MPVVYHFYFSKVARQHYPCITPQLESFNRAASPVLSFDIMVTPYFNTSPEWTVPLARDAQRLTILTPAELKSHPTDCPFYHHRDLDLCRIVDGAISR